MGEQFRSQSINSIELAWTPCLLYKKNGKILHIKIRFWHLTELEFIREGEGIIRGNKLSSFITFLRLSACRVHVRQSLDLGLLKKSAKTIIRFYM